MPLRGLKIHCTVERKRPQPTLPLCIFEIGHAVIQKHAEASKIHHAVVEFAFDNIENPPCELRTEAFKINLSVVQFQGQFVFDNV